MAHGGDRSLFGVSLRAATGVKFDFFKVRVWTDGMVAIKI